MITYQDLLKNRRSIDIKDMGIILLFLGNTKR